MAHVSGGGTPRLRGARRKVDHGAEEHGRHRAGRRLYPLGAGLSMRFCQMTFFLQMSTLIGVAIVYSLLWYPSPSRSGSAGRISLSTSPVSVGVSTAAGSTDSEVGGEDSVVTSFIIILSTLFCSVL